MFSGFTFKKNNKQTLSGARTMVQQFRVCSALAEDSVLF